MNKEEREKTSEILSDLSFMLDSNYQITVFSDNQVYIARKNSASRWAILPGGNFLHDTSYTMVVDEIFRSIAIYLDLHEDKMSNYE